MHFIQMQSKMKWLIALYCDYCRIEKLSSDNEAAKKNENTASKSISAHCEEEPIENSWTYAMEVTEQKLVMS